MPPLGSIVVVSTWQGISTAGVLTAGQTRDHILCVCPNVMRKEHRHAPSNWEEWVMLLKANSLLGAFPPALPLVEEEKWDPG